MGLNMTVISYNRRSTSALACRKMMPTLDLIGYVKESLEQMKRFSGPRRRRPPDRLTFPYGYERVHWADTIAPMSPGPASTVA